MRRKEPWNILALLVAATQSVAQKKPKPISSKVEQWWPLRKGNHLPFLCCCPVNCHSSSISNHPFNRSSQWLQAALRLEWNVKFANRVGKRVHVKPPWAAEVNWKERFIYTLALTSSVNVALRATPPLNPPLYSFSNISSKLAQTGCRSSLGDVQQKKNGHLLLMSPFVASSHHTFVHVHTHSLCSLYSLLNLAQLPSSIPSPNSPQPIASGCQAGSEKLLSWRRGSSLRSVPQASQIQRAAAAAASYLREEREKEEGLWGKKGWWRREER